MQEFSVETPASCFDVQEVLGCMVEERNARAVGRDRPASCFDLQEM
jgi:hypothetical protein